MSNCPGTMLEEVILVNELDEPLGVMEKMEAHRKALLHRAFSVFIFNSKKEMLLQRRSPGKYHSAGLWTNACCSHPRPGEDTCQAARRRLSEELGFTTALEKVFDFTYKSTFDNGLTEHEFDHVFVGYYDLEVHPNPEEVSEYRFVSPEAIKADLAVHPAHYTSWFHLAFPLIGEWTKRNREP
ncbi:isopentenyl-diphosphate Delta-isomerase [Flavitalea sp. BT771]|uniref:isopentenyl-diphosphate Delta-isomerase n=1 Tax=Flavitalea sp. BT771 TaxID=3063329 RepID=UPI0026E1F5A8|nr:isopentenyl-diphosphate Delta-isomerase [Flavitalea sp. BT771]MDO6434133.1 isopentenyl-diphosphate Delta-isomerase [Flavitalea sp. BT771]MDV6223033.1 isopentenyl-diphosphate Delta-isomerase [Flavitalea sp. BT771]